jgi:hypothetical protein
MADLIIFRCPQTDMEVQTLCINRERMRAGGRAYETVNCSACTRLHFIDKFTGKALGQDK